MYLRGLLRFNPERTPKKQQNANGSSASNSGGPLIEIKPNVDIEKQPPPPSQPRQSLRANLWRFVCQKIGGLYHAFCQYALSIGRYLFKEKPFKNFDEWMELLTEKKFLTDPQITLLLQVYAQLSPSNRNKLFKIIKERGEKFDIALFLEVFENGYNVPLEKANKVVDYL